MEQNNKQEQNNNKQVEEVPETNKDIICPTCNRTQNKIITVLICEAKNSTWYKCSKTKKCPLFQNKNT
jgi:hypothetical protein